MTEPTESSIKKISGPEHILNLEYARRERERKYGLTNSLIRTDGCFVDAHYASWFGDKVKRRFVYDWVCYELYVTSRGVEFRKDNEGLTGVSLVEHPDFSDIERLLVKEFDCVKEFDVDPENAMVRLSPCDVGRIFPKMKLQEMAYAQTLYDDMMRPGI